MKFIFIDACRPGTGIVLFFLSAALHIKLQNGSISLDILYEYAHLVYCTIFDIDITIAVHCFVDAGRIARERQNW